MTALTDPLFLLVALPIGAAHWQGQAGAVMHLLALLGL